MLEFALFRQIVLLRQALLFGIGLLCFGAAGLVRGTQSSNDSSIELPLHQRIDELVENDAIGPLASLCSDADFLRRVTLDLAGTIPTVEQVNTFLDDRSLNKREVVVDRLIMSQDFVRHMAIELDVILLERRSDKSVAIRDWERYLIDSIASDKPLDQLFQELIFMDSDDPKGGVPAKFILNRDAEPNAVTRDIGRLAFGMDLQCAQCHDHPLVKDYLQDDYYGLFAYWHRIRLFTDPKSKVVQLSEQADGEASFSSVFTGSGHGSALPRPPRGSALVDEPTMIGSDAYIIEPAKDNPGKPKFSRRQALSKVLSNNPQFRRNIANRLWLMMFGRGIVHPIDLHHSDNPPVNPRLLRLLADEVANHNFQLRPILRQFALTRAYQRACDGPSPTTVNFRDIAARQVQLSIERDRMTPMVESLETAAKSSKAAYDEILRRHEIATVKIPPLLKKAGEAKKKLDESAPQVALATQAATKLQEQSLAVSEAATSSANASSKLPEDQSLKEIAKKLESRAAELSSTYKLAAKKHSDVSARHEATELEFKKTQAEINEAVREQIRREELEPVERLYLSASMSYEDAIYDLKGIKQKIAVCDLAADYAKVRESDAAKAESAWQSLVQNWTNRNQIAALKPLTPVQLAVSTMRATGSLDQQIEAARTKLVATPPDELKNVKESDKKALEERLMHGMLIDQLRGTVNQFVGLYGGLPGEDFQATVNQALFFGNGSVVDGLLKPANNNLTQRLSKLDDANQIANELYLAILSRPASDGERHDVAKVLSQSGDLRTQSICELGWALLSSTEFRFNY